MKKTNLCLTIATILTVVLTPCLAKAATINYGCTSGMVYDQTGSVDPDGSVVELGYWTAGFDFTANTTFSQLNTAFHKLDQTTINGPLGATGEFYNSTVYTGAVAVQLYIWVFNSNQSAWAIVTNPASAWIAPADPTNTAAPVNIDTSDSGTKVPTGTLGTVNGAGDVHLQSAPEPTSIALLGSGLLMLGSMIRRRK